MSCTTYEAGKSYNTEKGGVVGPLKLSYPGILYCTSTWLTPKWVEESGEPVTQTGPTSVRYGRLTTEA